MCVGGGGGGRKGGGGGGGGGRICLECLWVYCIAGNFRIVEHHPKIKCSGTIGSTSLCCELYKY